MKPRDNIYISLEKIDDRLSYSRVLESFYVDYMRIFFSKNDIFPCQIPMLSENRLEIFGNRICQFD